MKGLLIATLLGGLACGVFAFLLGTKHNETQDTLVKTEVKLDTTTKQKNEAIKAQAAAEEAQKVAENNLADAKTQIAQLEGDLQKAQADKNQLQTALNEAQTARDEAQTKLAELQAKFPDKDPEDLEREITAQQQKIAALNEEKTILEQEVKKKDDEIVEIGKALERSKEGELPPGISGRIAKVNQDWNFVVLDIGYKSGIVPNGELVVYRGNQMIGRIKVTSASPDTSVANILPEWQQAPIRPGDKVLNGTRLDLEKKTASN